MLLEAKAEPPAVEPTKNAPRALNEAASCRQITESINSLHGSDARAVWFSDCLVRELDKVREVIESQKMRLKLSRRVPRHAAGRGG